MGDTARRPEEVAEALRRAAVSEAGAALDAAIRHHANTQTHPSSRGPARAVTVTATADEFLDFIRRAAREAGIPDRPAATDDIP